MLKPVLAVFRYFLRDSVDELFDDFVQEKVGLSGIVCVLLLFTVFLFVSSTSQSTLPWHSQLDSCLTPGEIDGYLKTAASVVFDDAAAPPTDEEMQQMRTYSLATLRGRFPGWSGVCVHFQLQLIP